MNGTVVDSKYQIISCLGRGGMGAVYEARHLGTGRRVALKMINAASLAVGGDVIPRFQREARASGAIDSEHVVQVLDTGVDPQTAGPYLVMECLSGEDLQQLVQRVGPLAPEVVLRIIAQACAGLARAHETGIIHRDIKSANVFVSQREGGEVTVKILDFGIAKVRADPMSASANQGITRTGTLLGSPLYMSPEQVLGSKDIDPRSDIFSLGATMYEALCGATPHHDCETIGLLIVAITSGRVRQVQERAPWVPAEVAAVVHQALSFDASARYQTAAEMLAAITSLLPQGPSLRDSMLSGVSPETKNVVSSKLVQMTAPLLTPVPKAATASSMSFTNGSTPVVLPMRSAWRLALPIAVILLGVAALGLFIRRPKEGAKAEESPAAALHSAPPSATMDPSPPPPPPVTASSAPLSTKDEVDASARAAASSSPGAVATAAPGVVARPRPAVMASAAPAPASPNCDPPFTFNADGKKIWKRECL